MVAAVGGTAYRRGLVCCLPGLGAFPAFPAPAKYLPAITALAADCGVSPGAMDRYMQASAAASRDPWATRR